MPLLIAASTVMASSALSARVSQVDTLCAGNTIHVRSTMPSTPAAAVHTVSGTEERRHGHSSLGQYLETAPSGKHVAMEATMVRIEKFRR